VVPLILIVIMLALWLAPLTLKEQLLIYFLAEVTSAWESTMVLFVSLIAAVLQIGQLAQFIVDAATLGFCGGIQDQLATIDYLERKDQSCFDVVATLLPLSAIYGIASFGFIFCNAVAFRLMHAAITDRELAMRRKPSVSPGAMTGCQGFFVRRSLVAFGEAQMNNNAGTNSFQGGSMEPFNGNFKPTVPSSTRPNAKLMANSGNPVMSMEMDNGGDVASSNPMFGGQGNSYKQSYTNSLYSNKEEDDRLSSMPEKPYPNSTSSMAPGIPQVSQFECLYFRNPGKNFYSDSSHYDYTVRPVCLSVLAEGAQPRELAPL
jgi:hypothetical protein